MQSNPAFSIKIAALFPCRWSAGNRGLPASGRGRLPARVVHQILGIFDLFITGWHIEQSRIGAGQVHVHEMHDRGAAIFRHFNLNRKTFQIDGVPRRGLDEDGALEVFDRRKIFDTHMTVQCLAADWFFFDSLARELRIFRRKRYVRVALRVGIDDISDFFVGTKDARDSVHAELLEHIEGVDHHGLAAIDSRKFDIQIQPELAVGGGKNTRHAQQFDLFRIEDPDVGLGGERRILPEQLDHGRIASPGRHLRKSCEGTKKYSQRSQAKPTTENYFFHVELPENDTISGTIRQKIPPERLASFDRCWKSALGMRQNSSKTERDCVEDP